MNRFLMTGLIVASFVIFIVDIQFSLGFAGGTPYALLVMATYWNRLKRVTIGIGLLATILTVTGFFLSQFSGYILISMGNRLMAIGLIWGSVWFVNNYKTSLEQVRKSERRFSALFDAAAEGMIITDMKGAIVMANAEAENIFGYHREEFTGKKIEVLMPRHLQSGYRNTPSQSGDFDLSLITDSDEEIYGIGKDGVEKPIEVSYHHFETEEGRFVISYIIDISRRKKMEKQLIENERRFHTLFQAATDEILVFQLDEDLRPQPFMEVNQVACDLLGYSRDEMLKMTLDDVVVGGENVQRRIEEVVRYGKRVHQSYHLTRDGKNIPLEISARSFQYEGRPTVISVGRDIRERRKLEQEILDVSENERRRIGRDMHDDLGQLLTGIGLIAKNLANKMESKNLAEAGNVHEIAEMVREADEHARTLARGLVPVNVESNGLNVALRELAKKSARMYEIKVHFTNGEEFSVKDNASALHLYRIVQEAVNNAVKHGKATSVKIGLSLIDQCIDLRVIDNGSGFKEYTEAQGGIGLDTMKFRAQLMGGSLEVNNREDKSGTEIVCRVPLYTSGRC